MSKDADTAPAAETEIAETTSLTDILDPRDAHERTPEHEAEVEVGDPKPERAASPPSPPAPAAPAAPASPPAAPAAPAEADPATDPKAPKWYRDHMAKTNRELAATRAENERLRTAPPAPAERPAAPAARTLPNPAEDPQGYHDAVQAQYRDDMATFQLQQTETVSRRFAMQQHGVEAFQECQAWLSTQPKLEAQFLQEPDPWGAAFAYYNRERVVEEIGDDPAAYKKRIEDEVIAKYEARLAADADQHEPARTPPTMRPRPPAPASTVRSAAPDRERSGKFAGPTPLSAIVNR